MKVYKIRFFFFCIISSFCNAQTNLPKVLQKDISLICHICKKDTMLFNSYEQDDFHLAHFFLKKRKIDSSFFYVSKLLENNKISAKKKYILYYIKGLLLNNKSLHKASNYNFKKAISFIDNDYSSINKLYIYISQNYLFQKKQDSAIIILEDWKKKHVKNLNPISTSVNFHNLGVAYLDIKNYKKAEENLLKSQQLNILLKDTLNLAYSSIELANAYYVQYKDSLAIVYFKKGLAYAKKSNDLKILQNAYKNMAVVEKNRKDYKKAFFYQNKYDKIKDSIWDRDKIWQLAQTDKDIATAINTEKLDTEKNKTKRALLFTGVLSLLLLAVSIAVYKINKQRKLISTQKNNLEDLHTLKDDLFAILGHDLRAPMHHILHLNKQMLKASKDIENKVLTDFIKKNATASNKMHLILDNILHWILLKNKQGYFRQEIVDIPSLIKIVKFDFEALLQHKSIKTTLMIDDSLIAFVDINSLKVVLRNILDNAIKFTPENGYITIKGITEKDTTILSITDTGVGMDINTKAMNPTTDTDGRKSTGLGLRLCTSFMKRNGGNFKIESKKGVGTTVFLSLSNKKN